jgi:hypothetical protein
MYRGTTKDGREVFGWVDYNPYKTCFEIHESGDTPPTHSDPCGGVYSERYEVIPSTIAMKIGKTDKHDTDIYGSKDFGFGMTDGHDKIRFKYGSEKDWSYADAVWYDGIIKIGWENDETMFHGFVMRLLENDGTYFYRPFPPFDDSIIEIIKGE